MKIPCDIHTTGRGLSCSVVVHVTKYIPPSIDFFKVT